MAKRIISVDGLALVAEKHDIYTIIPGSDGYDYIVELDEHGTKFWKQYEYIDDDIIKKKPIILETKFDDFHDELNANDKLEDKIEEKLPEKEKIPIVKKILIKKQEPEISHPPPSSEIVVKDTTLKKITLKPKVIESTTEKDTTHSNGKKLSKYHTFIKEFLAEHSDITWNERMKAANEAWKVHKESIQ